MFCRSRFEWVRFVKNLVCFVYWSRLGNYFELNVFEGNHLNVVIEKKYSTRSTHLAGEGDIKSTVRPFVIISSICKKLFSLLCPRAIFFYVFDLISRHQIRAADDIPLCDGRGWAAPGAVGPFLHVNYSCHILIITNLIKRQRLFYSFWRFRIRLPGRCFN